MTNHCCFSTQGLSRLVDMNNRGRGDEGWKEEGGLKEGRQATLNVVLVMSPHERVREECSRTSFSHWKLRSDILFKSFS